MPGIHHQASRLTATPGSTELGRLDWLVLGSSALVAGAVAHALSGVVAIAKDMVRPAPVAGSKVNERDGWILISTMFVITGAMAHTVARVLESTRAVVHPTDGQPRS
ncbi:hypothetical protein PUR71_27770 [Streptomyces sp. SP17BM10]|uniref:hypothetical protein n=1 Tax=Streptomyces sp. SP17BM10 TaxID=3002530 RepID=UPI002E76F931|nr:hypothetical protein [Streptomyces sp. SP17BM10]MEE1786671.1 hypothetical protein [Streptomyces sp. SP17BM10]